MYDIIIIGAGPAGLTAGIYGTRAHKKVLILEATTYGGQIITTANIENYPACPNISGADFAENLYNQTKDLGAEIKFEKVIDIVDKGDHKEVVTVKKTYQTKTIILATGSDSRKLGLDNEDKLMCHGLSYCATSDGNFFKNKNVAVVGGGNTALSEALYLTNIAKKVYLIHRRDNFKGEEALVKKLKKKENVEFVLNSSVVKLNGSDKLESIDVINLEKEISTLNVSGLFVAVGRIPENQNFAKLINLDENGYVLASEDCLTNVEGIYVAGDNRVKTVRQLVTAESDGAVAALAAVNYLNK